MEQKRKQDDEKEIQESRLRAEKNYEARLQIEKQLVEREEARKREMEEHMNQKQEVDDVINKLREVFIYFLILIDLFSKMNVNVLKNLKNKKRQRNL